MNYCSYAHDLLVLFVEHAAKLYGRAILVYNVHGLVHLAEDVRKFGCLDSTSSFPYENYLKNLKKLVLKPYFPLQQVMCLRGHGCVVRLLWIVQFQKVLDRRAPVV